LNQRMKYQIHHTTDYAYAKPVLLQPHTIRLRPRCDGSQSLHGFSLRVSPEPSLQSQLVGLDGNAIVRLWFPQTPTVQLSITAISEVETHRTNPFDYFLESWATKLPPDYPASMLLALQPYLAGQASPFSQSIDPIATQLAQDIWLAVDGNPLNFLTELNNRIYKECTYQLRETGDPLPPGVTWAQRSGSCRDFAILFAEACRAMGLAARFVSGYQEGDLDNPERHLHAWAEVYLPGGGWRGYDPTQGLAVSDRHIALVASPFSRQAAPVSGSFTPGGVASEMSYELRIKPV
jgi:transglutaminase-like putative cysteine protease